MDMDAMSMHIYMCGRGAPRHEAAILHVPSPTRTPLLGMKYSLLPIPSHSFLPSLIKVGEQRMLKIPPNLGYGSKGAPCLPLTLTLPLPPPLTLTLPLPPPLP